MEPLFVAAPLPLTRDFETRARDFIPDHVEAGWQIVSRQGTETLETHFDPGTVTDLASAFSREFNVRFGESLLDNFLFALEIASRYGKAFAVRRILDKPPIKDGPSGRWLQLAETVAGFDLATWALLASLENPSGSRLSADTATDLVLISKRFAAHAFGSLRRMEKGGLI